jgi:outer membrane immunogenic protein
MQRKLTFAALAASMVVLATSAGAADLGSPYRGGSMKDGPAPVAYARPFSWTGLYVGAQVGYAWGNTDATGVVQGANQSYNYDTSGWVGGGHAGYNWQNQNLVFGIETDIEGSSLSGSGTGSRGLAHDTDINWMGSLRGRLGIAYDRTLFYATAGWAYGDVNVSNAVASFSEVRNGWTAGVGVEHAYSERMTMRLEYRYTDLGSTSFAGAGTTDNSDVNFHAIRAGVSFKF